MVFRVYVEKKQGFDVEAKQLANELKTILGIASLKNVRLVNRYDVEGISEELFAQATPTVFSEPQVDNVSADLPDFGSDNVFAVEYLPGQFDQRADSASECIQLISQGERPTVRSAKVYALEGELGDDDIAAIKHYVINPVEAREASLDTKTTLKTQVPVPGKVEIIEGFRTMSDADLEQFIADRGLAMDLADLQFCRAHFTEEQRDPTITEIKVIDTYWSDHCRHTTFGTQLDDVQIDDATVQAAFDKYLEMRHELGRDEKPVCLMDMGTIGAKWLKKNGILKNLDESEEINACTVKVKVDVNGHDEDWLFLFKNETHNHPTEIEPFGGAATCIGGCIRDPLSGRSYVYQAMRVTGAADPTVPVSETLEGKLPQRKLVTTAAAGYSSYGNQIGVKLADGISVDGLFAPAYGSFIIELADTAKVPAVSNLVEVSEVGETTEAYQFVAAGETLDLAELQDAWEGGIESVFPYRSKGDEKGKTVETVSFNAPKKTVYTGAGVAKPHVIIPVFPGNNCEYDSAAAFERAGADVSTLIVNNLTPAAVAESTAALVEEIRKSQIIMIPGGFSGGDEPDGSAKFITAFFRAPAVTEAVRDLLNNRDGLMLGICNGFQALIKLGLVPYGDIVPMTAECPTLTFNTIGRHQSRLVRTRVASNLSPWLAKTEVGDMHTIAISHGEGRFVASDDMLAQLKANGQIATQYVDEAGVPGMDLSVNPNGSLLAIEGITSPDGRVFGKMGHSERYSNGTFKNVPGEKDQPLFAAGVEYFAA